MKTKEANTIEVKALKYRNVIISAIYVRPKLCISMPEHERNFLRLLLVRKTSDLLKIKQLQQSENFRHLYLWTSFISFFIADFARLLNKERKKQVLKTNQLSNRN